MILTLGRYTHSYVTQKELSQIVPQRGIKDYKGLLYPQIFLESTPKSSKRFVIILSP